MVELDLLTQLGSLIKHDQINEPELDCGCFSSHLSYLILHKGLKLCDDFNYVFIPICFLPGGFVSISVVTAEEMKSHRVEVWLNVGV